MLLNVVSRPSASIRRATSKEQPALGCWQSRGKATTAAPPAAAAVRRPSAAQSKPVRVGGLASDVGQTNGKQNGFSEHAWTVVCLGALFVVALSAALKHWIVPNMGLLTVNLSVSDVSHVLTSAVAVAGLLIAQRKAIAGFLSRLFRFPGDVKHAASLNQELKAEIDTGLKGMEAKLETGLKGMEAKLTDMDYKLTGMLNSQAALNAQLVQMVVQLGILINSSATNRIPNPTPNPGSAGKS